MPVRTTEISGWPCLRCPRPWHRQVDQRQERARQGRQARQAAPSAPRAVAKKAMRVPGGKMAGAHVSGKVAGKHGPPSGYVKKFRRWRPGTVALREIR
eukprot:2423350-Prymnesium_polylepis.1